jgi:UDP-3-O-[3-hydroxymyristoyl] glucosamine N-acyltransferase
MSQFREKFPNLKPEEISYDKQHNLLLIRGNTFQVENAKIAFIEALNEWSERNTYETMPTGSRIQIDSRIGDEVRIGQNCTIGGYGFGYQWHDGKYYRMPHLGDVKIDDHVTIHNNTNIDRSVTGTTHIGEGSAIDSNVHIGHNAKIGKYVLIAAGATIGGSAHIGDKSFIGCNAFIKQKVYIGSYVTIGAGAVVACNVPDGETWGGIPAVKLK